MIAQAIFAATPYVFCFFLALGFVVMRQWWLPDEDL